MPYKILITKERVNEKFEEEMKAYAEARKERYGYSGGIHDIALPVKSFDEKCLETTLTDEEFNRVRLATIKEI